MGQRELCRLEHVSKSYDQGESVTPLRDISLVVQPGDFVAIEGPSGAGKSTLLYVIGLLLGHDAGELYIDGQNVAQLTDREKTALRAETIGIMFQDANFIQALTARENLRFAQTLGGTRPADPARLDALLAEVGLDDRAEFFPHQLSGGQKRRLMAAEALVNQPSLILVDEPTNDLNREWTDKLMDMLMRAVDAGAGLVMVTHQSEHASKATRTYRLEDGQLNSVDRA